MYTTLSIIQNQFTRVDFGAVLPKVVHEHGDTI